MTDMREALERPEDAWEKSLNVSAMVGGLHALIFGVHSLGDPELSHEALSDEGNIHEYIHSMLRLLPSPDAIAALSTQTDVERLVEAARSGFSEGYSLGAQFYAQKGIVSPGEFAASAEKEFANSDTLSALTEQGEG